MVTTELPDPLVAQCLEHLRRLPFVRRVRLSGVGARPSGFGVRREVDAILTIDTPDGAFRLQCEIKRSQFGREAAHFLIHSSSERGALIVLAPAVSAQLGDLFERAGVNFVDAAGNCFVQLGDRYVTRIQGRKAGKVAPSDRGLRAPAYRALFALLVRPELLERPARALAENAGVSPQTAVDLRKWLVERRYVLEVSGRRRWAPGRWSDALALWLGGFTAVLAPRLLIGRYRASERDPVELERRIEPLLDSLCSWRYGGGAAAMRLTGYYRGDRTVLYVREAPMDFARQLRFAADAAGPIVVARLPAESAFESPDPRCVHPLLAYADLLVEGHDRAREAAQELHTRYLRELEQTS